MFCQKWEWWQWALMNHFLCTESWVAKLLYSLFVHNSISLGYFKSFKVSQLKTRHQLHRINFPFLMKLGHGNLTTFCLKAMGVATSSLFIGGIETVILNHDSKRFNCINFYMTCT